MRLLNTDTLEFAEFFGSPPRYAILSHTWEDGEVSLREMMDGPPSVKNKQGYRKVVDYCRLAVQQGYAWAWVDTCCINKTSDAELSESINSMFRWYQEAAVCHVFLSDLSVDADLDTTLPSCRWFTRGWTLQELIAPRTVEFYDRGWVMRGTKESLGSQLCAITMINQSALAGGFRHSNIAERMSWVALRETTRPEDIAYCMLGLFDVSMPMLYGEGKRAFRRLQEELIRQSNDLSIFAWNDDAESLLPQPTGVTECSALLAPSPRQFAVHQRVPGMLGRQTNAALRPEYAITNKGLRIRTQLLLVPRNPAPGIDKERRADNPAAGHRRADEGTGPQYLLAFNEDDVAHYYSSRAVPGILLDKVGPNLFQRRRGPLHWLRAYVNGMGRTNSMEFYIKLDDDAASGSWNYPNGVNKIFEGPVTVRGAEPNSTASDAVIRIEKAIPDSHWDHTRRCFFVPTNRRLVCAFSFTFTLDGEDTTLLCVIDQRLPAQRFFLSDRSGSPEAFRWFSNTKSATGDTSWDDILGLHVGWQSVGVTLASGISYSVGAFSPSMTNMSTVFSVLRKP